MGNPPKSSLLIGFSIYKPSILGGLPPLFFGGPPRWWFQLFLSAVELGVLDAFPIGKGGFPASYVSLLGGGFNYFFIFTPIPGEMIRSDYSNIFSKGLKLKQQLDEARNTSFHTPRNIASGLPVFPLINLVGINNRSNLPSSYKWSYRPHNSISNDPLGSHLVST